MCKIKNQLKMMFTKKIYEAPSIEVLQVELERGFAESLGANNEGLENGGPLNNEE